MHILIVDDEALARSRLRTLLGDCDARHQVMEAAHAGEALARLGISGGRAVDLVLIDSPPHAETEVRIAVRAADKDKPWVKTLVESYQTPEVRDFILAKFKGAVLPAW